MAIWSLIMGICTVLFLGPLAGLVAIISGDIALRDIAESKGSLRGSGLAKAGLVLGYGGSALWLFALVLFFPAIKAVRDQAHNAEVRVAIGQISGSVKQYYTEYGRYPLTLSEQDDLTFSTDNNRLFDILRAIPGTERENPRRVMFFEGPNASSSPPKSGFGSDGVFYDTWGKPYHIRIDTNYDGGVANPYSKNSGSNPVPAGVIVWSLGKDGEPGARGDGDGSADFLSWQ